MKSKGGKKAAKKSPSGAEESELEAEVRWMANQLESGPNLTEVNSVLHLSSDDPALGRIFASQTRLMPFSHRPLFSIRHPYVQHCTLDAGASRRKKAFTHGSMDSRMSLMGTSITSKLRFKNTVQSQAEEKKWVELAHLVDVVALEDQITARRASILSSGQYLRWVDLLWISAVGPDKEAGMEKAAHIDITCAAWKLYVAPHTDYGSEYFSTMMRGCEADWEADSGGRDSITYGEFAVSLLELVDNWTPHHTSEEYASSLSRLVLAYMRSKGHPTAGLVSDTEEGATESDSCSASNASFEQESQRVRGKVGTPPRAASPLGASRRGANQPAAAGGISDDATWSEKKAVLLRNHAKGRFFFLQPCLAKVKRVPGSDLGEYYLVNTE